MTTQTIMAAPSTPATPSVRHRRRAGMLLRIPVCATLLALAALAIAPGTGFATGEPPPQDVEPFVLFAELLLPPDLRGDAAPRDVEPFVRVEKPVFAHGERVFF